MSVTIQSGWCS